MVKRLKAFESDFDWEQLHQLADRDTDFEIELLQIFLEDIDHGLGQLAIAIAAGDADTVEQLAHSIRGAAANIGAVALAQTADQLEQLGQRKQLPQADSLLSQLRTYSLAVEQHLQRARVTANSAKN